MPITRRDLVGLLSGSTFALSASPAFTLSMMTDNPLSAARFPQGVASGDPGPESVMLWTRAEPVAGPASAANDPVNLVLEISTSEHFTNLRLAAPVSAAVDSDYTVRAFVDGLEPDTFYFYRFRGGDRSVSRIGRTRTAPASGNPRAVNIAFASCQSYEQAHYGAWARMLADDQLAPPDEAIDVVLHLGDFIYERCWHRRLDGTAQARKVPAFPDGIDTRDNRFAVSLADYRHLYKVYLSDPHLQAARARWPFVCTWDDHEYSNDNFQSYSTYGGDYVLDPQRKLYANQAWFEFIPAMLDELIDQPAHNFHPTDPRTPDNEGAVASLAIHRRLAWGDHLDIVLTDNRSYRTPPCLPDGFAASMDLPLTPVELVEIADAGREYAAGQPPETLRWGDGTTPNPARERDSGTILGRQQRGWFLSTLQESQATWKLWGNSLPLIPMRLDLSSLPFTGYEDSVFNLDAWPGFPTEQRLLMDSLQAAGVTGVVSLSGDHHMHGAGTINRSASEPDAPAVAVDFTVAGTASSPIFGDLLEVSRQDYSAFGPLVYRETGQDIEPVWNLTLLDGVLPAYLYSKTGLKAPARWMGPNKANPGLRYVDTTANGYGLARFAPTQLTVKMITLADCTETFQTPPAVRHTATFQLPVWRAGAEPDLKGPAFTGGAPFPFEKNDV